MKFDDVRTVQFWPPFVPRAHPPYARPRTLLSFSYCKSSCIFNALIVSMTKYSLVISSPRAYLLRNRPRSICFAAQGGNYTKSRPGGRRVELWRQPRVSLIRFFLVTFRYFVSEMVLTCAVSIYIICKYGNGEIFTQSEEENGSRHLWC